MTLKTISAAFVALWCAQLAYWGYLYSVDCEKEVRLAEINKPPITHVEIFDHDAKQFWARVSRVVPNRPVDREAALSGKTVPLREDYQ